MPTPASGCPALEGVDLTRLEVDLASLHPSGNSGGGFTIGHVDSGVNVTRVEELSGQKRSAVPPPREVGRLRGQVLGGLEFVTRPRTYLEGSTGPESMIEARITLTLDGSAPIDLPTRFVPGNENFDQVAVSVPDVGGAGSLSLSFVWADDCFRYEGSTTIAVDVVPRRETDGCELEEEAYWDQLGALLDGSLMVAGTTPHLGSPYNASRFAPYENLGIDAFIAYLYDADGPEPDVTAGSAIRVESLKTRLHLARGLEVIIWTRRSVAKAVRHYPPQGAVKVYQGKVQRQADGSYTVPVPDEPGRYVVALSVKFESRCTTGTLWATANLAVS